MCSAASVARSVDRPEDGDWNWGESYTAQVCHALSPIGTIPHLKIRRHDGRAGISWDVLQRIKNDMVGPDMLAIEMFPPDDQVVNDANIRHLWIVPQDLLPFGLLR